MHKLITSILGIKEKLKCHTVTANMEFVKKCSLPTCVEVEDVNYSGNNIEFITKQGDRLVYDKSWIRHLTVNFNFKRFELFEGVMLDTNSSLTKPKFYRYTKLYKNINLK